MSDTAVGAEGRGYNRGLILGFTMAESLLLVVFCLLLVTAAIISKERDRASEAEKRAVLAEREVAEKRAQIERLIPQLVAAGRVKSLDEWRELVEAKTAIDDLSKQLSSTSTEQMVSELKRILEDYRELQSLEASRKQLETDHANAELEVEWLKEQLAALKPTSKPHEWPPIITLSDAKNNYFRSGSAEVTANFEEKLNSSIAEQIASNLQAYGADIVEVIGHTDEQPLSRSTSNMDKNAIDVLLSRKDVGALEPADNAGLGLARAISVANVLRANPSLGGVTVLPLSAAQLILPGDKLTGGEVGAVETRRRIEIRIRRRDTATQ
ncbi:hypothetical protein IB267_31635 [Ensifer sp. ENS09]|uniref:hypothetical protein n=1 Tax=Ensifer sp. ENS09 TaxID=2769263 RepID=UPI00177E0333|nr:hypothetical protein [Ensifer sp. ENS09]MBD9652921.1 hypothetical protein [Ensifer sp. ENS09]